MAKPLGPFFWISLFMILQMTIGVFTPLFFWRELAEKFDNRFKKHMPLSDFFNPFWPRYARAGVYACWIGAKNIFARNLVDVQNYDFRSQISARTYKLCRFHTFNVIFTLLTWVPGGFYLIIRDWLR